MEGNGEEEDVFSIVCGDLGLGESTRSRNYLELEQLRTLELSCSPRGSPAGSKASLFLQSPDLQRHLATPGLSSSISSASDPLLYESRSVPVSCHSSVSGGVSDRGAITPVGEGEQQQQQSNEPETFPTYADVPLGTSMRQHKKLFDQEVENLRRQHCDTLKTLEEKESGKDSKILKGLKKKRSLKLSGKEISNQLTEAMAEMEELKLELDTCRRRLDAKYQAVAILKEQAEYADAELKNTERRANETSRRLEQEVNKLQFELEWKESSFIDSQQTWADRFDSITVTDLNFGLCGPDCQKFGYVGLAARSLAMWAWLPEVWICGPGCQKFGYVGLAARSLDMEV
ncbi:coiled-coil domain-containing protein 125 [Plakobranchus ocellatus]|uniref:Coiled-coil domain-containing protein 125 n=1 Tax=Plakobranchus ocellatus TaxID=259542 RepID=A0AAV4CWK0_9GAST|nr:coiled-coil domain-containing protein 125 [Plakobranchus ocellatus]